MAELKYSKQATKYLRRMQETHAKKMRNSLQNIAAGNDEGLDIKPMTSLKAYRLRQGNYRALYFYRRGGRLLIVAKVGTRGDFYK
jgi:mRNA-degrading endonuclease RelE of RelBE toxin-antitoxin system